MAGYTKNYNFKKPTGTEYYNIEDANINNEMIDGVLYEKVDKIPNKSLSTNDFTDGYKKKIDSMQTLYRFKGTVNMVNDLSAIIASVGDTYKCKTNFKDYTWNGTDWVDIGKEGFVGNVYIYKLIIQNSETEEITLPCNYEVEKHVLDVFLNGERLLLSSDEEGTDGHYVEIGEANSVSNKIKMTTDWSLQEGDVLDLVVRGDYSDTNA